jgi:hypothetical protein
MNTLISFSKKISLAILFICIVRIVYGQTTEKAFTFSRVPGIKQLPKRRQKKNVSFWMPMHHGVNLAKPWIGTYICRRK